MNKKIFILDLFLALLFAFNTLAPLTKHDLVAQEFVDAEFSQHTRQVQLPQATADFSHDPGFSIIALTPPVIKSQYPDLAPRHELWKNQIAQLLQAESLVDFFDQLTLESGDIIDIPATLDVSPSEVQLYELSPVIAQGLDDSWEETEEEINCFMQFPTPYEKGQILLIVLGFAVSADPEAEVKWVAVPAIGCEADPADPDPDATDWVEFSLSSYLARGINQAPCLLGVLSGPVGRGDANE